MADSLEDDFALSDVESVGEQSGQSQNEEGERTAQTPTSKRKKEVHQQQDGSEELTEEEKRARKKRKMKEQDKKRKAKKAANGAYGGPVKVAQMSPDMQADHLRNVFKSCKQFGKMSEIELDDVVGLQERMLRDTTSTKMERKLENLVDFIQAALPSISADISKVATAEPKKLGRPVILVITGHAQRAADLAKILRKLTPSKDKKKEEDEKVDQKTKTALPVAKLFARHFKVAEQQAFLESNVSPIAVGTPQRIHDLLKQKGDTNGTDAKEGAPSLKLDCLRAVILDASWTDVKMRSLLDGIETKEAVCSLLADPAIQTRFRSTKQDNRAVLTLF